MNPHFSPAGAMAELDSHWSRDAGGAQSIPFHQFYGASSAPVRVLGLEGALDGSFWSDVPTPSPAVRYDAQSFADLTRWNQLTNPLLPSPIAPEPASISGAYGYSPLKPYMRTFQQAVDERAKFMAAMQDPRRRYASVKNRTEDFWRKQRRRQNKMFQYVDPSSPEGQYILQMLEQQTDPETGVAPTHASFLQDRM